MPSIASFLGGDWRFLGGWIDGMFDSQGRVLAGTVLAAVWLASQSPILKRTAIMSVCAFIEIPDEHAAQTEALKCVCAETEGIKVLIEETFSLCKI